MRQIMQQKIGKEGAQKVAILGAAGKMGSGIALLILQQFALGLASGDKNPYRLILIDSNELGFATLKRYLRDQLKKHAERIINELRNLYKNRINLIDNGDMINTYVEEAIDCVFFGTLLDECLGAELVFEAIIEDVAIKSEVFAKLNKLLGPDCYYFTNTSSIPIHILQEKSNLQKRLIGFHFYNPPAVQRLLELIVPENTLEPLKKMSENIANQLKKTVVYSRDVAGFIGNGHFIREVKFACKQVNILSQQMPLTEAIVLVNRITQDYLLRPMGIFQLVDYVGIDVVQRIAHIMSDYLQIPFGDQLIDAMVKEKIWGGQFGDGSQKDGFFQYQKGMPVAIYDIGSKKYILCKDNEFSGKIDAWLGDKLSLEYSWNKLIKDPKSSEKINEYLKNLSKENSQGIKLADKFLKESKKISLELVKDGIAHSIKDVETVLKNGFLHLY